MIGFMVYCGGLVAGIIGVSWIVEMIDNSRKDSWRNRVTADDSVELKRLFDDEGATVAFNEKGEKFLVGYLKD